MRKLALLAEQYEKSIQDLNEKQTVSIGFAKSIAPCAISYSQLFYFFASKRVGKLVPRPVSSCHCICHIAFISSSVVFGSES